MPKGKTDYLEAYRKGTEDSGDGKPCECEYSDPELVEAYEEGYWDEHNTQTIIKMGR
jgi:hypothetical protein